MKRRELMFLLGGAAISWPFAGRAQQKAMPVIGYLSSAALADSGDLVAAFRQGLSEARYSYCVITMGEMRVCAARCSTDIGRGFWQGRR